MCGLSRWLTALCSVFVRVDCTSRQFCNSYITLYYIAFFKPFAAVNGWNFLGSDFECLSHRNSNAEQPDCFEELSTHLLAMFCTQLLIQNIKNVVVPLCCGTGGAQQQRSPSLSASGGPNEQLLQDSESEISPRYIEEARLRAREYRVISRWLSSAVIHAGATNTHVRMSSCLLFTAARVADAPIFDACAQRCIHNCFPAQ